MNKVRQLSYKKMDGEEVIMKGHYIVEPEEEEQKAIEEMAKTIFKAYGSLICQPCGSFDTCEEKGKPECGICAGLAEELLNVGYGNIEHALTRFAEKLKEKFGTVVEDCMDGEYVVEKINEILKEILKK